MRHLLLALAIALLPVIGLCQTPTFTFQSGSSDTATANYTSGSELTVTNYIKSIIPDSVRVAWKVIGFGLGVNWKVNGFCDNSNCFPNDPSAAPPSGAILNGGTNTSLKYGPTYQDFHILYDPVAAANGTWSWVKVNVKDVATPYMRNVTFIGTKNPAGVFSVSTSSDDVILYPIPAHEAINVIFDEDAGVRAIAIYNLIGKLMGPVYRPTAVGSARIDMSEMPNGVYFLRLLNSEGRVLATRRFTRQ
jgi:hypothetical protein